MLRAAFIILVLYVILSVSEISHDQSEENVPVSSSVGSFTIVQDDVRLRFLLRGKWHEVPIGDFTSY